MANLTVTPAGVLKSTTGNPSTVTGKAGAAITAGQPIYADPTDGSMKLSDANGVSPANTVDGISLHAALTGQPIQYAVEDDDFSPGFTTFNSAPIWLSETAGALTESLSDLSEGSAAILVGVMKQAVVGTPASKMTILRTNAGVVENA